MLLCARHCVFAQPPITQETHNLLGQEIGQDEPGIDARVHVPKYGKGHEDRDTMDHFRAGELMPETNAQKEIYVPHFGHGNEDKAAMVRLLCQCFCAQHSDSPVPAAVAC